MAREGLGLSFGPVADGEVLPGAPLEIVRKGFSAGVPVMLGTNRDEVKLFAASVRRDEIDDAELAKRVGRSVPKASTDQVARA